MMIWKSAVMIECVSECHMVVATDSNLIDVPANVSIAAYNGQLLTDMSIYV